MRRAAIRCLTVTTVLGWALPAFAQAIGGGPASAQASPIAGETLLDRTAVARGRQLLYAAVEADRRRGVERLASAGTPQAVDALLEALETGSVVARDPAARLLAVRLLSSRAARDDVRNLFVRELHEAGGRRDPALRSLSLLRRTAALALARAGDDESLKALVAAAAQRGPAGDAAREALVVAPPPTLASILFEPPPDEDEEPPPEEAAEPDPFPAEERAGKPRKPAPKPVAVEKKREPKTPKGPRTPRALLPPLLTLLGDLGDVRAIAPLREELGSPHRPSRAAAAVSLAKLGDVSVGEEVVPWLDDAEPRVVGAAAEVLVTVAHPKAPAAVTKALRDETTRSAAIGLAHDLASPALRAPLVELLPKLEGTEAVRAVMALGRSGAAADLAKLVEDPLLAPAAITALGTMPRADAANVVSRGLADPKPSRRRAFARAALVRAIVTGDTPAALERVLGELATSKDASDRETSAFGRVALGLSTTADVLGAQARAKQPDLAILAGASRGAAARGGAALEPFVPLLEAVDPEAPSPQAIAAGVALLDRDLADRVPFTKLLRLAENGGALAPVAARSLPRRDDGVARERIRALLAGTDAGVRLAVALGYGEASEPSSVSILAARYHEEDDDRVRRAIVHALGMRTEAQRERVLEIAASVDPDPEVRRLARQGLGKRRLRAPAPFEAGLATLLVVDSGSAASPPPLRLVLPSGLTVPVLPAPDGALLLAGVPFGPSSLELTDLLEPSP